MHTCSKDAVVRAIASQETRKEANQQRPSFKPYQVVVSAMQEDPGMSSRQLSKRAKSIVEDQDTTTRLAHSTSLARQNKPLKDDSRAPHLWSDSILTLHENVLSFALNALTDTLPHNANLHLWGKSPTAICKLCDQPQSLLHMLNACPYALNHRRYNDWHDSVLGSTYTFLKQAVPSTKSITADLPSLQYNFPQEMVCTNSRPDIVVWDQATITIIELTVPFELCFNAAVQRKMDRYAELRSSCQEAGYKADILTIEVGSRGFINTPSFNALYEAFPAKQYQREALEQDVVCKCILESYRIWCKLNWKEPSVAGE